MEESYQPQKIEEKIQHYWEAHKLFQVTEDSSKEKFYCLTMFPYPSGHLHMGHVRVYTIGDVLARYQRMLGKNVLQPMGWDAFGLPAENAAIKNKTAPAEWTYKNIDFMRNQMIRMGLSYDWSRELATCDPEYYRWEQWLFLQLYKKGLVYKKNAEVNWDPVDNTVLANEQVIDGRGWRSGALVERREIPQWFFKITAYAEELLNDLDTLTHWPEQVKTMQRNWIGRSEGVEIQFSVLRHSEILTIYTTRPDTLFGVTYVAIAPQHPLANEAAKNNPALAQFIEECRHLKTAEADFATMEKRGVLTELKALHPLTNEELPIWVANFVVMEYGAGAVMAVPAHDQRDFEFAKQYGLPIKSVITPHDQTEPDVTETAFTAKGILKDSAQFTDLDSETACQQIIDALEKQHLGKRKIHFRLRDWGISRQRYWGAPIPMINCPVCGTVPASEDSLPITLPENVTLNGTTSPLKNLPEFYETTCPQCHGAAQRETDTFDTFFESSWYYARYACKHQDNMMLDKRAKYWTPVDQYVGGIEHAILHLLYARFLHKAIRDEGLLDSDEPFTRLLAQGMVLNQGAKMSKSVGNTVDPEKLIAQFGADTVRLFMIFAAPPEQNLEWSNSGVEGAHRFLKRLWAQAYEHQALIQNENKKPSFHFDTVDWNHVDAEQKNILRQLYEITEQCKYDYERQQLNTVVSGCMKLFNLFLKLPESKNSPIDIRPYLLQQGFSMLLSLLSPIAPHITHQLWEDLGYPGLIMHAAWPKTHLDKLKADHIELGVQINGKLRSRITIPAGAEKSLIEKMATDDAKVHQAISGMSIKKIIIVPGKLVNIVTGEA